MALYINHMRGQFDSQIADVAQASRRVWTTVILATALAIALFGFMEYRQSHALTQVRDTLYDSCVLRNDNTKIARDLWLRTAQNLPSPKASNGFTVAAQQLHLRDCSVYSR